MAGTASSGGILYGPTASGKRYLSMYAHRGANPQKSEWHQDVPPDDEYALFETADDQAWMDINGDYWSLRDGGALPVGTRDERIAKHPKTSNARDPWHGYPASPAEKGSADAPAADLLDRWLDEGVIGRPMHRRILRRRI